MCVASAWVIWCPFTQSGHLTLASRIAKPVASSGYFPWLAVRLSNRDKESDYWPVGARGPALTLSAITFSTSHAPHFSRADMAAAKRVLEEAAPLLPYDAVFRIEVSLSSQTTSAVVMRTTARLYNLEGVQSSKPSIGEASLSISLSPCEILPLPLPLSLCWAHVCVSGAAEWKSVAYGAPCIQLIRHGNGGPNSMFTIRVVVAEVESGLCVYMHERERERERSKQVSD